MIVAVVEWWRVLVVDGGEREREVRSDFSDVERN